MDDEAWEAGTIVAFDEGEPRYSGVIETESGRRYSFTAHDCCRDGTSIAFLQLGDTAKRRTRDGAISSPNWNRWNPAS